jgi:uncharacterized membrane protein
MEFGTIITTVGEVIDVVGVIAIVVGVIVAMADAAIRRLRHDGPVYTRFRRVLGRGILIGLELLVAADIIRTVAVEPTLESVGVLALIVVIRTFLSWSLEVEIAGRWPWQKSRTAEADAPEAAERPSDAERV